MRGFNLALFFGASAAFAAACSVYDSSLLHDRIGATGGSSGTGGSGGGTGGGGTAGTGGGGVGGQTCSHVTFPPPPADADVKTHGGDIEAVGVMKRIDLGDAVPDPITPPTHWQTLGFDIDDKCTFGTGADLKKGQECAIPTYGFGVPDGPDGQDNALGKIVQLTRNSIGSFSSEIYSEQLAQGVTNVIVHLKDYNGEPNDDQVTVETMVSAPFWYGKAKGTIPKWDGTDEWPIASDSVKNGDRSTPKASSNQAYVTNGKVVVSLPSSGLRLVVGLTAVLTVNLDVQMLGANIACDLVQTNKGPWGWVAQNCTLGARWKANELVHQLGQFPDPANNQPLCLHSNLYSVFRDNICGLVDVSESGLQTASDPCTAISMGLTFDTEPGLLGNVFQVDPPRDPCAAGDSPAEDNCEDPHGTGGAGGGGGAGGASTGGRGGTGGTGGAGGTSAGGTAGSSSGGASPKDAGPG